MNANHFDALHIRQRDEITQLKKELDHEKRMMELLTKHNEGLLNLTDWWKESAEKYEKKYTDLLKKVVEDKVNAEKD